MQRVFVQRVEKEVIAKDDLRKRTQVPSAHVTRQSFFGHPSLVGMQVPSLHGNSVAVHWPAFAPPAGEPDLRSALQLATIAPQDPSGQTYVPLVLCLHSAGLSIPVSVMSHISRLQEPSIHL